MSVIIVNNNGGKDAACQALLQSYNAQSANEQQMQAYAECVQRLHRNETDKDIVGAASGIVLMGVIIGVFFMGEDRIEGLLLGALSGFGVLVLMMLVLGVLWGIS